MKAFERWEPEQPGEFYTAEGQLRRIERMLEKHNNGERWPGVILADGVVIGQITVSTIIRGSFQKGHIGYWVGTEFQGKGHATRAVDLTIKVMADELGLRRAEAETQLENLPSQRVLRRNGFTPYGIAHSHIFVNGEWRDEVLWERLLDD